MVVLLCLEQEGPRVEVQEVEMHEAELERDDGSSGRGVSLPRQHVS